MIADSPAEPHRPDLVFVLADDLGYADLGCTGARDVVPPTPTLDHLAANGLLCTAGYSNSPVCSPTRFALATGRWQYRLRGGSEEPLGGRAAGDKVTSLDPRHPTLASLLAAAGYHTALVGKWHLGNAPGGGPRACGYDYFFGCHSGAVDYFSHRGGRGGHDLWENEVAVRRDGYLTDLISDAAVGVIEGVPRDQPLLLSVHYTAPHWPWETRADRAESERIAGALHHLDGGSLSTYRQMVREMDEGIGRILAALAASGRGDDTLVVFTSDNGGERYSDTWPFLGQKMDLLEGGIRVPTIAHWPQRIRPGNVTATPVITMDWTATMLAAAGVAADPTYPLDGQSLLPLFDDPAWAPDRALFWRMKYRQQRALRRGCWKYLRIEGHEYVFDIERDPRERANLARRRPDLLDELRAEWERWDATMPPIPDDAGVHPVYDERHLPRPAH